MCLRAPPEPYPPSMIFDAHLDLSMNALEWNRDLRWSVEEIRASEAGMTDKPDRGRNTVSLPAMRRGGVGICVATQIARYVKPGNPIPGWHSPEQAYAQTQGQLAWYRAMEEAGELRQVRTAAELGAHVAAWTADPEHCPIGYILSLEGADSIVDIGYLERAYAGGLRAVGPAHYGPGTYAFGTDSSGGIGQRGRDLLREMERLGIVLDATHLCDESFWEAMDVFGGRVWASHSNARALVDHNRQFTDEQLRVLIDRGAVIGIPLDAWMMVPGWVRGTSTPENAGVTLSTMLDHLDHICQLAGDAEHVGIGTDLDGGFGTEQGPSDLDTIADLRKLPDMLAARGYDEGAVAGVMSENFLRFLRGALPAET